MRYYGYYSNVSRRKRRKENPEGDERVNSKPEIIDVAPPPISKVEFVSGFCFLIHNPNRKDNIK